MSRGTEDHVPVCLDAMRALIPAFWLRPRRHRRFERPHPANSGCNNDTEPLSRRTPGEPRLDRRNDAQTKVF
jgi:hypothetical protein